MIFAEEKSWDSVEDLKEYNKNVRKEINKKSEILELTKIKEETSCKTYLDFALENLKLNSKYRSVMRKFKLHEIELEKEADIKRKTRKKLVKIKTIDKRSNKVICSKDKKKLEFKSQSECADFLGITQAKISSILRKESNNMTGWKLKLRK